MDPALEPRRHRGAAPRAGDGGHRGEDVGLAHRPAAAALPEPAHHRVETGAAPAAAQQLQVERQRDQRAERVVADRRVECVLVAAVVLDPGIEARAGQALHLAPRRREHAARRRGEQPQVARHVDQAGAQQEQIVVVAREALEEPEQLGVVLLRVVVAGEVGRTQPLDVPGVEVLVADEAEQPDVAVAGIGAGRRQQVAPVRDQRRAGAVLEAAMALLDRVEQEQVARERRRGATFAVPERDLRGADAPHVGEQPRTVETRQRAGDDERVPHPAGLEAAAPEAAELERVVDELVVVGGLEVVAPRRRRHCGGHLPVSGQPGERHAVALVLAAVDAQEHAGAVEEAAPRVEVGAAHRDVEAVDEVDDGERGAVLASRELGRLVELAQRDLAPVLACRESG